MARLSTPQKPGPVVKLLTSPTPFPPMRRILENDLALFQRNPPSFDDKQSILETEDAILYELVKVSFDRENSVWFEGSFDSTTVVEQEMVRMLTESSLVEV